LICVRNLVLEGQAEPINLELTPGMQVLCIASDELEIRRLVHLFTGFTLPVQGDVLLNDVATSSLSRNQLLEQRRSFGIVTASGGLVANLKLWENITLPLHYSRGQVSPEAEQQALALLAAFGYHRNLLALPGHLSTFERRMAAFIRAAITAPSVMLYAGCFDNLTVEQRQLLLEQAQRLQQTVSGLASLYLTASSTVLSELQPDLSFNLKHHASYPTRSA